MFRSEIRRIQMITVLLGFFGATFIYTGYLASGRDLSTGLVVGFIGLILMVKPALHVWRYVRINLDTAPRPDMRKHGQEKKPKKIHLKVVKAEDEKPTIH